MKKIKLTDEEWRQRLTPDEYRILRTKGTEMPFSGDELYTKSEQCERCTSLSSFQNRLIDATVVHSDGGPSMTSKTVATFLTDLGVVRSRSRPRVSNDNPYSESLFKTMKYLPVFPERFSSLAHARAFMDEFVHAYNRLITVVSTQY